MFKQVQKNVTEETKVRYFAFVVSVLILYSTPAFPEIFNWTDGSGTEHFTDDRAGIPSRYRKKAVSLGGYDADSQDAQSPGKKSVTGTHGAVNPSSAAKAATTAPDVNNARKPGEEPEQQLRASDQQSELDSLARSLLQNAESDRDKAYAIFSWIRANIYYDNAAKWQRRYGREGADQSPAGVLASKKGVCEGIANLFSALANNMGLQSTVVTGRASGMRQEPHAWNAVMIDSTWGLVDITRHSFLSPPQEFLARHFPNDPQWQLLDKPLTYEEWLKR